MQVTFVRFSGLTDECRPLTPTTKGKNYLTEFYRSEKVSSASEFSHVVSTSSSHLQSVFRARSEHAKVSPAVTVGSPTSGFCAGVKKANLLIKIT